MNLIKHTFNTHSSEANFRYICGINGCLHSFKSGMSFKSFTNHASRKHSNWPHCLSTTVPVCSAESVRDGFPGDEHDLLNDTEAAAHGLAEDSSMLVENGDILPEDLTLVKSSVNNQPTTEKIAALFLLNFKERYKLTQTSINFAVGAINGILDGVCSTIQQKLQNSLEEGRYSPADHFHHDDPFDELQTEYQQSNFYQQEFGLIVSFPCP